MKQKRKRNDITPRKNGGLLIRIICFPFIFILQIFLRTIPSMILRWISELESLVKKNPRLSITVFVICCIIFSFAITFDGIFMWDEIARIRHAEGLMRKYRSPFPLPRSGGGGYASLMEVILGICVEYIFKFLRDPFWVRHAITFLVYPLSMGGIYVFMRKIGVSIGTTILCIAGIYSIIRLGGLALINMKDFPIAIIYILSSVGMWFFFNQAHKQNFRKWKPLVMLGILAPMPFLLRSPVVMHFLLLCAVLFAYAILVAPKQKKFFWPGLFIPIASGILFMLAVSPGWWAYVKSAGLFCSVSLILIGVFQYLLKRNIFTIPKKRSFKLLVIMLSLTYVLCMIVWSSHISSISLLQTLVSNFKGFQSFVYVLDFRFFGIDFRARDIPAWFPFLQIPVIIHPLGLLLALIGFGSYVYQPKNGTKISITLPTLFGKFNITLKQWLWLILISTWSVILIDMPAFFDEGRHIFFMYPIFFFVGFLGLDWLRENTKVLLACLLFVLSTSSYIHWERFSYVYKSPIVIRTDADDYDGDYWGTCIAKTVKMAKYYLPDNTEIRVRGIASPGQIQDWRMRDGLLSKDKEWIEKNITVSKLPPDQWKGPNPRPAHAIIALNKYGNQEPVWKAIEEGRAKLLWKYMMPPNNAACILAYYQDATN